MSIVRSNIPDAVLVVGLAAVVAGCALIALPLGLIVGGALTVALVLLIGGA